MKVLLQRVDAALDRSDGDAARVLLEPALVASPWRRDLLERHAQASRLRGDAQALLRALSGLRQLGDESVSAELRRVAGMLVATEREWVPRLGPLRTAPPGTATGRVVRSLLGEPGQTPSAADIGALTAWVHATGLEAHAMVVPLGAPLGQNVGADVTAVTAGCAYPAAAPLPDAIRDQGWLTARALGPIAPELVIVDGPWYAAIAATAVHAALRVPVVVGRCAEPPPGMLGLDRARMARARSLAAFDAGGPRIDDGRLAAIASSARAERETRPA